MPIRYEAPAPLDAGLLDALARGRGDLRDAADYRAQLAAQADFARTAVAAGAQRADAGNMQFQAEFARDQLEERQRQFNAEQANQFALVDRRAQAAAWLNQQDMSFAEQLRLQRLQAEVGAIEADDTLARFEKDELILQKRSGIDMGRRRLEETRARQEAALAEQQLAQGRRFAQMEAEAEQFAMKPHKDRIHPVPPELGGGFMMMTGPRQWKYEPPPKDEGIRDAFGRTPQDWVKAMRDAQVRADEWVGAQKKIARDAGLPEPQIDRQAVIAQDMQGQGFDTDMGRHFGAAPGGAGGSPVPAPPGAGEPGGGLDPIRVKAQVGALESWNRRAESLPEAEAAAVKGKLGRARGLLEAFGGLEAAPPEVRREYESVLAEVMAVLEAAGKTPDRPVGRSLPPAPFMTPPGVFPTAR